MGRADSLEKAQAHNIVLASGGATAGFESVVLFTYFIPWARAQVEGPARTQAPTLAAWPIPIAIQGCGQTFIAHLVAGYVEGMANPAINARLRSVCGTLFCPAW